MSGRTQPLGWTDKEVKMTNAAEINYSICVDCFTPLDAEYKEDALAIGGIAQSWVLCASCYAARKEVR
jgi:hypothetical protein